MSAATNRHSNRPAREKVVPGPIFGNSTCLRAPTLFCSQVNAGNCSFPFRRKEPFGMFLLGSHTPGSRPRWRNPCKKSVARGLRFCRKACGPSGLRVWSSIYTARIPCKGWMSRQIACDRSTDSPAVVNWPAPGNQERPRDGDQILEGGRRRRRCHNYYVSLGSFGQSCQSCEKMGAKPFAAGDSGLLRSCISEPAARSARARPLAKSSRPAQFRS
jgi:hypothetical protein